MVGSRFDVAASEKAQPDSVECEVCLPEDEALTKLRLALSGCACSTCETPESLTKQRDTELEHPQAGYWRHSWKVKGPGPAAESNPSVGWTLSGHSRSLERSGFVLNELNIFLDAGVGWRADTPNPEAILVTHGHIDHINALPLLLRCGDAKPFVFVPKQHVNNVREMCRLTWAVKMVDGSQSAGCRADVEKLPDLCNMQPSFRWFEENTGGISTRAAPPVETAVLNEPEASTIRKNWVAAQPGLQFRLPGKRDLVIRTVHCYHKTGDVGYVICDTLKTQRGATPEAEAEFAELKRLAQADRKNGKAYGQRIQQMRKESLVVNVEEIRPVLAYLLDTTAQVFAEPCARCRDGDDVCEFRRYADGSKFSNDYETCLCREPGLGHGGDAVSASLLKAQRELIFRCGTIVVECTFLGAAGMSDEEAEREAIKRTHTSWTHLKPHVLANPQCCFVLVHFSRRYKDGDIKSYFAKERTEGPEFRNVVLWLDSGIIDFST